MTKGWKCRSTWKCKNLKEEDTHTLAQCISLNQERERERAANCEKRRLIFEMSSNKETMPAKVIPGAFLVYKILQENLTMEAY